ncbi:MAG: sugar phosphate isomerase/epimerase [Chloroflexia bacterium]|nr:sugar phosphate isomerase/epimerase [Chloroflexia bacterium]
MVRDLAILIACRGEDWAFAPALAQQQRLGLEIGDLADPNLLEGDWRPRWQEIAPLLQGLEGGLSLHGPRSELNPGLRDQGLVAFCRRRYRLALGAAAEIGAGSIVFHTGFNPLIRAPGFDERWIRRSADFWRELAQEAAEAGLQVLLENVWEPQPELLRDLVREVGAPNVGACFDVGHANVYSRRPASEWASCLGRSLRYVHLHNNDGRRDSHAPLEEGTVDFSQLLPQLAISPQPPRLVLEVSGGRRAVTDSLFYLRRLLGLG